MWVALKMSWFKDPHRLLFYGLYCIVYTAVLFERRGSVQVVLISHVSFLVTWGRLEMTKYLKLTLPDGSSINRDEKWFHTKEGVRFRRGSYRFYSFRTKRDLVLDSTVRIFFGPVWIPGFSYSMVRIFCYNPEIHFIPKFRSQILVCTKSEF